MAEALTEGGRGPAGPSRSAARSPSARRRAAPQGTRRRPKLPEGRAPPAPQLRRESSAPWWGDAAARWLTPRGRRRLRMMQHRVPVAPIAGEGGAAPALRHSGTGGTAPRHRPSSVSGGEPARHHPAARRFAALRSPAPRLRLPARRAATWTAARPPVGSGRAVQDRPLPAAPRHERGVHRGRAARLRPGQGLHGGRWARGAARGRGGGAGMAAPSRRG